MIKSGRDPRVKTDIQNPMYRVLLEVLNDRDQRFRLSNCSSIREQARATRTEHHRERESRFGAKLDQGPKGHKGRKQMSCKFVFSSFFLNGDLSS